MLVHFRYSEIIAIIIKKSDKMANYNVKMPRIDSWCRTRAAAGEEVKFTFAWTIERFSERPERNCHNLLSNIFTVPGPDNQNADWRIELYPKGAEEDLDNFLSCQSTLIMKVRVKFRQKLNFAFLMLTRINKTTNLFPSS